MLTPEMLRRYLTPLELTVLQFVGQGIKDPVKQAAALAASAHTVTLSTDCDGNITGVHSLRRPMLGGSYEPVNGGGGRTGAGFGSEKSGPMAEGPRALPTPEQLAAALETAKTKVRILAARNGGEPVREKPPPEPVHRPLVGPVRGAARQKVRRRRKLQAAGKPVTVPDTLPTPKEVVMSEVHVEPEGFADRVAREAQEEAQAVLADLERLKFRADQVARVLKALELPLPTLWEVRWRDPVFLGAQETPEPAELPAPTPGTSEPVEGPQEPVLPPPPPAPAGPPAEEETVVPPEPAVRGAEVPEHLRKMPAARTGGPLKVRVATAEDQLRILNVCEDGRDTFITVELREHLPGMNQDRIGAHVKALADAGLIQATGQNRRPPGVMIGKAAREYRPLRKRVLEPTATHVREAKRQMEADAEAVCAPEDLAKVRDHVTHRKDEFTPKQVSQKTMVKEKVVRAAFQLLISRGSLVFTRMTDTNDPEDVYRFVKPTDPGDAARADAGRREQERDQNGRGTSHGSMPVPGTGPRLRASGPNAQAVNELLDELYDAGHVPTREGGHFIIKSGHTRLLFGSTPGTHRAVLDARTRLRNVGILPKP